MSEVGQTLINIVRQKAAAQPGFVYEYPDGSQTCMYVSQGKPSCLIGQALWAAGLIDASLEDSLYNTESSGPLIDGHLGLELDDEELAWLRAAQRRQDTGRAWGDAVIWADRDQGGPLPGESVA